MRQALWIPNFGPFADPRALVELAREAEAAGWEGLFLWDHIWRATGLEPGMPVVDPWVALAAVAASTERLVLGTLVTPLPRRRPWKLAREVASLAALSGGRVILGVGAGSPAELEMGHFGEDADARVRAEKLDEGLAVLNGLWSGVPFAFRGAHYAFDAVHFAPRPGRIPIWVASVGAGTRPLRRAARWDGVFPLLRGRAPAPDEARAIRARVRELGARELDYDLVVHGVTCGDPGDVDLLGAYRAAGVTWWLERLHPERSSFEAQRERVRRGPTRTGPRSTESPRR